MTNAEKLAQLTAFNYVHRWAYTNILDDTQKALFGGNQAKHDQYLDESFRWLKQAEALENGIFSAQRRIIAEMATLDDLDLRLRLNEATGLEFNKEDIIRIQAVLKRITEENND
jgi:hypothetical protein